MSDIGFAKGKYTWLMHRRRVYGKRRWVIGILKGDILSGMICYHPVAKQMVFNTTVAMTLPLMKFAEKLMDINVFHSISRTVSANSRTKKGK